MNVKHPYFSANVIIIPTSEFSKIAAQKIETLINSFDQNRLIIGLSGGSTPAPVYSHLSELIYANSATKLLTWLQIDERLVAPDSSRSNQKMISETLFSKNPTKIKDFIPFPLNNLRLSEQEILVSIPQIYSISSALNLSILGIGTDGHTASLFPELEWSKIGDNEGYAIVKPLSQPEARITLSLSKLMLSEKIVFLVSGEQKQDILEKIFINQENLPTTKLCQRKETIWLISDNAVSKKLSKFLSK